MGFAPVKASKEIFRKYISYLSTIFEIADESYSNQFKHELEKISMFSKGPYLDVTDSFLKGMTISEMVNKKILQKNIEKIKIPITRPLYKHQENAIIKAIQGENIVVSTGTGSGKTESFLIPIFNYLTFQNDCRNLTPGVRALLIYPMNALANDQIERLRELLSDYPEITYGAYTGQTKEKYQEALVEYKKLNNGTSPNANELISREQIKKTPPNILITNYAMLEYLMLRPDDSVFFDGAYAREWKFIVLDEAHVYNGSTGIEVSMLLRRLKAKLDKADLQYILTSATLGNDDQNIEVAEFATRLCNSEFNETNIIRAIRSIPTIIHEKTALTKEFYTKTALLLKEGDDNSTIRFISNYLKSNTNYRNLNELIYEAVLHDETFWKIRSIITTPKTIESIAATIGWEDHELADFVTVASKCEKNGERLFDARYHMFLRATESVFITLNPDNKLFLTRKDFHIDITGLKYKVFEIATCNYCHQIYLIGKIEDDKLVQHNHINELSQKTVFLLGDKLSDTDEEHSLEEENIEAEAYLLCAQCGMLHNPRIVDLEYCEHDKKYYVNVIKVAISNETGKLTKCIACENTSPFGILRIFFTGQEAVTSVIGTALFEELPSYSIKREYITETDDTGFGSNAAIENIKKIKEAKQFLSFSDSRQAAAFYACYFDQTYRNILYKRLIFETLNNKNSTKKERNVPDFVNDLIYYFEKYDVATETISLTQKEAWKAVLKEIVDNNGNNSLFSMGLIGISVDSKLIGENKKFNLSSVDVAGICSVFILGMSTDAAISYDAMLNTSDCEYFTHNGIQYSYTLSDSNPKSYKRSFIPTKSNMKNKRQDYLIRVLSNAGFEISVEQANTFLIAIWERILIAQEIIKSENGNYKVNMKNVIISKPEQWYFCPKCKTVTIHNVHNTCPSYRCDGVLKLVEINEIYDKNHYYKLYQNLDIRELRVVEHTAQLDKETAYDYQRKFKQKEIDVLSCSTTFEMGVDVGSLETVFMRNMPPSPANYAQRAGRAGRSRDSAAYAITFCNKSNHDFAFFQSPENMIKGRINPPIFIVENKKIAIRHLYASALSFFWKKYPEYFSKASDMADCKEGNISGFDSFKNYLNSNPVELKHFALRFLPQVLSEKFGVNNYEWVNDLLNENSERPGVLTKAIAEYNYEIGILQEAKKNAILSGGKIDYLDDRIRVYKNEEVLSFLSRKNVLPKYGFPVDTVEMLVLDKSGKSRLGLQLQRDLSIAISEYAPGSQIVANGNLLTSRYIKKIPNMSWKMFDYIVCSHCETLNIEPHIDSDSETKLEKCTMCNLEFTKGLKKTFLVPAFGFAVDGDKIQKPKLIKPVRTYNADAKYVGYKNIVNLKKFSIGDSRIELCISSSDEMAIINDSNFFVCQSCGFTDLDDKHYARSRRMKHKTIGGYFCRNDGENKLQRFSLGYRFETDVVQIRFIDPDIFDYDVALSLLYGLLKGICSELNIEQNDISGCLQYFYNETTNRKNYSLVLYDKTPGGAGHVKRLNNEMVFESIMKKTYQLMNQCNCGGELKDSSCYSCIRSYYNQRHHDRIKRNYVIDFIRDVNI